MPWTDSRAWLAGLGLSMLATAAHADVLVVRSVGPSAGQYRPGMVLPDNAKIVLRGSDVLTLLDAKGSWTLQGPITTTANTRARRSAPAPRLEIVNDSRPRIGAVRSVEGAEGRPNLWLVDVAAPGAMCVVDPAHPVLWRADVKTAGTMTITGPNGASAQVDWAAGQDLHDWPEALPVVENGSYRLVGPGDAAAVTLTFKTVAAPTDIAATGKALLSHGCAAQLDRLVAMTAQAEGS
jgi:hypothetical protein